MKTLLRFSHKLVRIIFVVIILVLLIGSTTYSVFQRVEVEKAAKTNRSLAETLNSTYYNEHLYSIEKMKLIETNKGLEDENKKLATRSADATLSKIDGIYKLYGDVQSKLKRNKSVGLASAEVDKGTSDLGIKFLSKDYDFLNSALTEWSKSLDSDYKKYIASLPTPSPVPQIARADGYSYINVNIPQGSFGVSLIKMRLSEVSVKTVTANDSDCANNCPTKSLADFVRDNGAYAGMNGTYICPPDYPSCAGKINTFDFAVYNSNLGKWINSGALGWSATGLATFSGRSAQFYRESTGFDNHGVNAGISNFPTLLEFGNIAFNDGQLTAYQKQKGTKGAIGVDDTYIYLALIYNATVTEEAHVLQSMGVKHALNLDGGGTSAMYIAGSYKVGPGRALPNAILLTR